MSEIKAIEKLREFIDDQFVSSGQAYLQGMAIAGSIEAEIAANYMRLPCDADGVPIHVGDKMKYKLPDIDDESFTILGVNNDGDVFHCLVDERPLPTCISYAGCLCHVKPRTLEDIVQDAIQYGYSHGKAGMDVSEQRDKYADEIRELLGGDAE